MPEVFGMYEEDIPINQPKYQKTKPIKTPNTTNIQEQVGNNAPFFWKGGRTSFFISLPFSCVEDYSVLSCMASASVFPDTMHEAIWDAKLEQGFAVKINPTLA